MRVCFLLKDLWGRTEGLRAYLKLFNCCYLWIYIYSYIIIKYDLKFFQLFFYEMSLTPYQRRGLILVFPLVLPCFIDYTLNSHQAFHFLIMTMSQSGQSTKLKKRTCSLWTNISRWVRLPPHVYVCLCMFTHLPTHLMQLCALVYILEFVQTPPTLHPL